MKTKTTETTETTKYEAFRKILQSYLNAETKQEQDFYGVLLKALKIPF